MIATIISLVALGVSIAPHVRRWLTKDRRVYVVLGDGCGWQPMSPGGRFAAKAKEEQPS